MFRIELLRAMDLRLLALHQEQSTAFGRAAAAGFSSKNMADLISFSKHFGAERLWYTPIYLFRSIF